MVLGDVIISLDNGPLWPRASQLGEKFGFLQEMHIHGNGGENQSPIKKINHSERNVSFVGFSGYHITSQSLVEIKRRDM
jgi:hypothetical protein